jgi:guanylate kinase
MPPAEFIYRKDSGFFLETSLYCGNYYGVRKEDIDEIIASGKCPVLLLDVNGALTLKRFYNSLNVFVPGDKATCIQNILSTTWRSEDSYPEVVRRIMGLDYELNNAVFCDEVTNDPNVILEYFNE